MNRRRNESSAANEITFVGSRFLVGEAEKLFIIYIVIPVCRVCISADGTGYAGWVIMERHFGQQEKKKRGKEKEMEYTDVCSSRSRQVLL